MNRLKEAYTKEVAPELQKKFGYKNVMQIPKLDKVVINDMLEYAEADALEIIKDFLDIE